MKRLSIVLVLAAAAALAGCKKKSSERKPETPTADTGNGSADGGAAAGAAAGRGPTLSAAEVEQTMTRMLALTVRLGDLVDANKDDCAQMAAAVEQVLADNQALLARAKKYKGDAVAGKIIEGWMKQHGKQMMAVAGKMAVGQRRCGSDPAVRRAFRALDM